MDKDIEVNGFQTLHSSPAKNVLLIFTVICIVTFMAGCARKGASGSEGDRETEYHADNDIAMVVRSLVDAVSVGEPLDSVDYDYDGVLTDGQGTPLYTDLQGSPGEWEINVLNPQKAVIRNLYLGDLLPGDLESYITQTLNLGVADYVETDEFDADDESDLSLYKIPGGELRFEVRAGIAPNGLESPLMSIVVVAQNQGS